jgi:uncharacterized membrane protein YcaP (DUF421 family)
MADWLLPDSWSDLLGLGAPLLESVLRGVFIYAGLIFLLRVLPRREAGSISLTDLLLANLIVEAVSNGLQGESRTVPSALLTGATVLLCAFAVDWLSYRFPWCRKLFQAEPIPLVRHGRIDHAALKEEMVTHDELETQARIKGLAGLGYVKHATMEPEGEISIVPREKSEPAATESPARRKRRRRASREEVLERLWALQRKLEAQHARIEATLQEMMLEPKR